MRQIKYKGEFYSQIHKSLYSIRILQENYSGAVKDVKILNPQLSMSSGRVRTTSLRMSIMSEMDGEFRDLYTENSKEYLVEVYVGSTRIYSGYVLPELYSEQYVAPPYYIDCTATDLLESLKKTEYSAADKKLSLLNIIQKCLNATDLILDFNVFTDIEHQVSSNMLFQATVNEMTFDGMPIYDVIEKIMQSTDSFIYQYHDRWVIGKSAYIDHYYHISNDLSSTEDCTVADLNLGKMGSDLFPSGALSMNIIPAISKKKARFSPMGKCLFLNSECSMDAAWSCFGYVEKPGISEEVINGITYRKNCDYYRLLFNADQPPVAYITQGKSVHLDEVKYLLDIGYYVRDKASAVTSLIQLKLISGNRIWYLNSEEGWVENESNIEVQYQQTGEFNEQFDKSKFVSTKLSFTGIPASGQLVMTIYSPYNIVGFIQELFIGWVRLTAADIENSIESSVTVSPYAKDNGEDLELSFAGSVLDSANQDDLMYNSISQGGLTDKWKIGTKLFNSYYDAIVYSACQERGLPRYQLSGSLVIGAGDIFNIKDVSSQKEFYIESYTHHLYQDVCDVVLKERHDYELTSLSYDSYISTGNGKRPSSGGESGGSGSGSVSPIQIIGTTSTVTPTDGNVYSALKTKSLIAASTHTHPNKDILDQFEHFLKSTDTESDEMDLDKSLSSTAKIRKEQLRKDVDDVAEGEIDFKKGVKIGEFLRGLLNGTGAEIDKEGNAELDSLKVRKKINVQKRIEIGDFISSMYAGMGAAIDENGNGEFSSLKVRNSLEVLELIFNRLSAIEGDQLLTEGDTIETVDDLGNNCYGLHLKRKWEGYFTAQIVNNVIKGIINTLAEGSGIYHTSWMRVNSVNTASNYIEVTLYPNDEVPSGTNYPPCAMMKFARWGNQTDTRRQSCLYLSSTEGRIVRLVNVTKPKIDISNYGSVIGQLPDFPSEWNVPVVPGQDYLYARGIVVQDVIRMDYAGQPVAEIVDRGEWAAGSSYYCNSVNPVTGRYEISDVWYKGCKYRCTDTGTMTAPAWNNTDWAMVEGNPDFTLDFEDTDVLFDPDRFNLDLAIIAKLHNIDITQDILDADVEWKRYSEDDEGNERVASDNAWAIRRSGAGKSIHLTAADCDFNGYIPNKIKFIATATLRDGMSATAVFEY